MGWMVIGVCVLIRVNMVLLFSDHNTSSIGAIHSHGMWSSAEGYLLIS